MQRHGVITGLYRRLGPLSLPGPSAGPDPLAALEAEIAARFPQVVRIAPAELAQRMSGGSPVMLLDVRTPAEFAVGHIAGAERCEPGRRGVAAVRRIADAGGLRDRTLVLVCAIGWRSACLAEAVGAIARGGGARAVANLSGGLMRWHNEGRPLVDDRGPTDRIHGYSRRWAGYVIGRDTVVLARGNRPRAAAT